MSQSTWRKSSFSTGPEGACLEVTPSPGRLIRLRESDDPTRVITTTPTTWSAFLASVKVRPWAAPPALTTT